MTSIPPSKGTFESRYGNVDTRANLYRKRLLFIRDRLIRSGDFKLRGQSKIMFSRICLKVHRYNGSTK